MDSANPQPPVVVLVFTSLAAIVLQLVVAPAITIFGVVPNFILVAVVITAMRNGPVRSVVNGFLLGLVFDFCSLGPVGVMAFVLTILSYAVSSLNKGTLTGGIIVDMVIMLAAISFGELLVSVIYAVMGLNAEFLLSLVQRVLPAIVYDTVIGSLFLLLYNAATGSRPTRPPGNLGRRAKAGRSLSRRLNR